MHILSVARGGTLTQRLPGHRLDALKYLPHDIDLDASSQLGKLLGTRVQAPASHHQAPDQPGTGVVVVGRSPGDEVIEAIELPGHRFGVGVHWHPEEGDDPRLLTALVNAATVASATPRRDVQAKKVQAKAKAATRTR